jgi:hypothetical protein
VQVNEGPYAAALEGGRLLLRPPGMAAAIDAPPIVFMTPFHTPTAAMPKQVPVTRCRQSLQMMSQMLRTFHAMSSFSLNNRHAPL